MPSGAGKEVHPYSRASREGGNTLLKKRAQIRGGSDGAGQQDPGRMDPSRHGSATPSMMKVRSPRSMIADSGLMPAPRAGTIVREGDLGQVGRSPSRPCRIQNRQDRQSAHADRQGKLHPGKLTGEHDRRDGCSRPLPDQRQGIYIKRVTMTSTMGPGIRVDANQAAALKVA